MAKAETVQGSTMEIVSLTRWRRPPACRCSSRGEIFQKRTCRQRWPTLEQGIKPHTVPCISLNSWAVDTLSRAPNAGEYQDSRRDPAPRPPAREILGMAECRE